MITVFFILTMLIESIQIKKDNKNMQEYKINVYNKGTIKYHYGSGLQIQECNILTGDIVNKAYLFSEERI